MIAAALVQAALALVQGALVLGGPASDAPGAPPPSVAGPEVAGPTKLSEGTGVAIAVAVDRGDLVEPEAMARTLRGHLADLGVAPRVEARDPDEALAGRIAWASAALGEGARAAFWIEPGGSADAASLFLLHGRPARLFTRPLELPLEPLERQEILGIVIRGLCDGLLDHEASSDLRALEMQEVALPEAEVEVAKLEPATPAEPTEVVAPEPATALPRVRLLLGLGYAGSSFAAARPWGSGAGLEIGAITRRGIVAAAEVGWIDHGVLKPTIGATTLADARLRLGRAGVAIRVGAIVRFGARRRGLVEPALVVRGEAPIWWPKGESRARQGVGLRVGVGPAATVGVELGRGLALALRAELDLWLRNLDLVAESPYGSVDVVRPPVAGASVLAGLRYAR